MLNIETDDVYTDFKEINEKFDFSSYLKDHPNYDKTICMVSGK